MQCICMMKVGSEADTGGKRIEGDQEKRWIDDFEEDLCRMNVQRWRIKCVNKGHNQEKHRKS